MLTFEIFSLDDNYQEVVIIQWYCSYHPVLSFDVWLHWNRKLIYNDKSFNDNCDKAIFIITIIVNF